MSAAQIITIVNLVGPSIEAGQKLYLQLVEIIAKARANNEISEEEQKALWEKLIAFRDIAENESYPPHWKPQ